MLRALASLIVLAVVFISYRVGYRYGYTARGPIIHFGLDVADMPFSGAKQGTGTYDPYFTRVNEIASKTK